MNWIALAVGLTIGILHCLIFQLFIKRLFSKQVFNVKRGMLFMFACFRQLISIGLAVVAIRYYKCDAWWLAGGFLGGFTLGRIRLMRNGK